MPDTPADELATTGPVLTDTAVELRLSDPGHDHRSVRVYQELSRPRDGLQATWRDGVWEASIPRPDLPGPQAGATRFEYAFIVEHGDGGTSFEPDPGNPLTADGPFGAKSVVLLPGYVEPAWVAATSARPAPEPDWTAVHLPRFGADLPVGIWSSPSAPDAGPAPLLLVHDGAEYAELSGLLHLLEHLDETGQVGGLRVALLAPLPDRRDETYSALARYADSIAFGVLPRLREMAPWPEHRPPTVMGASLGGVASLHLAHRHPARVGSLLLQSGSFFRHRTDHHERGFAHFDRVARFVGVLLQQRRTDRPRRIAMTCGTVEENLANNRVLAAALHDAGHDVTLQEHPDAHSFTSWRDALLPALVDVLS